MVRAGVQADTVALGLTEERDKAKASVVSIGWLVLYQVLCMSKSSSCQLFQEMVDRQEMGVREGRVTNRLREAVLTAWGGGA